MLLAEWRFYLELFTHCSHIQFYNSPLDYIHHSNP